jgi:hydroxymethylglutaryl-CoA reductase (NADPH)
VEKPKLPNVPRDPQADYATAAVAARHDLCERVAGLPLPYLAGAPVPSELAKGNIENMIGYAQVPVGIAGPLLVHTSRGTREVYVPMATTEGAMVASYSRGMRLLSLAGGARAQVTAEALSQHPVLVYAAADGALKAAEKARVLAERFATITSEITRHGRFLRVEPQVIGRRLILRLLFATGDAVGINMAARAADLCSAALARETGALERHVHGQDVEKRSNTRALVEGRGRSVIADVTVPRAHVEERLRTTPEALAAIMRTYATGYAQMATHNWLVQSANGLSAVMLACGQDVAYVTESANGFLDLEVTSAGDLYAAVTLPSLLVGTVGGGSGKGTANECLAVLGCQGEGHANTFAEILAATVLAGDLSLMGAFCANEFVAAHERLGRNRPT